MTEPWVSRRIVDKESTNPFSPTFGTAPPLLVGRDDTVRRVTTAVEVGPQHPDYTILITGPRGSGKTALLNAIESEAERASWPAISVSASTPGLCERITRSAMGILNQTSTRKRSVSSLSAMGFSVSWENPESTEAVGGVDLRSALTVLASELDSRRLGVLVTVDELQGAEPGEMRELAVAIQHVTRRESHPFLFIGAALPQIEDTLLADPGMTFFQRCARAQLEPLGDEDVAKALREPIRERGSAIEEEALRAAVAATSGYPFMVQLVGYHCWQASPDPISGIGRADVDKGVAEAGTALIELVVKPVWKSLSTMEQRFLIAMAPDDGPSRVREVAERIDRSNDFARTYRGRLIRSGLVVPAGRGFLEFAHLSLRDWLRGDGVTGTTGESI